MLSKMAVETPLLNALGMRPSFGLVRDQQNASQLLPTSDPAAAFERLSSRIVDASHEPLTEAQVREMLRLPKDKMSRHRQVLQPIPYMPGLPLGCTTA